jgi:hypothetical protein
VRKGKRGREGEGGKGKGEGGRGNIQQEISQDAEY